MHPSMPRDTPRFHSSKESNAHQARVYVSPIKALWTASIFIIALIGGWLTANVSAVLLFVVTTLACLCLGHSLGMHRKLIHNSYHSPKWLEYLFVHFGVLVGLAGPIGMIKTHDLRDWAQRQERSHAYFGHSAPFFHDAFWQLFCDIRLSSPPEFILEASIEHDRWYQWMEKTWRLQALPWALFFFLIGGLPWVIWGIFVRMAVCIFGHWLIGYFAHNRGHRTWHVKDAGVQGYNVRFCGFITMGECWHNNHHAFPGSARIGLNKGELDPGWCVLKLLQRCGLASRLATPQTLGTPSAVSRVDIASHMYPTPYSKAEKSNELAL